MYDTLIDFIVKSLSSLDEASQTPAVAPASIREPGESGVGHEEGVTGGDAYSRLQGDGGDAAPHTCSKYRNSLKILIPIRPKPT